MFLKRKCIQYWLDLEVSMDCDILILKMIEERCYVYYVICRLNVKYRQVLRENCIRVFGNVY